MLNTYYTENCNKIIPKLMKVCLYKKTKKTTSAHKRIKKWKKKFQEK